MAGYRKDFPKALGGATRAFLDLLFPRDCLSCGTMVEGEGPLRALCDPCTRRITLADRPGCPTCGYPMFGTVRQDHECPHCHLLKPIFSRGFTVTVMRGPMRDLIHQFKYRGNRMALQDALTLAAGNSRLGEFLAGGGIFVPVPLHARKQRERGFNQALEIARGLRRIDPRWTVQPLLQRVRDTPTQTLLARQARQKNLKNAFAIRPSVDFDKDSRLIIVDDVFTTGSTLNSCAAVLRKAGFTRIDVLTLGHG